MILKIAIAVVIAILLLLAFIASRPSQFRITRSAQLKAPPDTVFGLVNDFHRWTAWSPWEKLDPNLKRTFSGPTSGAGATYAWVGNSKAGEGRMTILDSKPRQSIVIDLEFIKPFTATNKTTFSFAPAANGTAVTWTMEGTHKFMMKAFGLFMSMEDFVGKDFEKGLASMDAAAQGKPAA